jgi:hypothetical protein
VAASGKSYWSDKIMTLYSELKWNIISYSSVSYHLHFVHHVIINHYNNYRVVKGKVHSLTGHESPEGRYSSTLSLISALSGSAWLMSPGAHW